VVDCANGIGGKVFPHFAKLLEPYLQVKFINHDNPAKLNDQCGADYVKTTKNFPSSYDQSLGSSCVCFDGDADRIILL
jgi:phosphoacetylglucosamine mutase